MEHNDDMAAPEAVDDGPHEVVVQRLPLETDPSEEPIPYALTARARRVIGPTETPELRVVGGGEQPTRDDRVEADRHDDELDDHRSVQARALRRAGMPVSAIAQRLKVDAFVIRAWLGGRAGPTPVPTADDELDRAARARELEAMEQFEDRIGTDPAFAAGIATLGAIADVDGAAVTLVSDRPAPLAQALAFLRREFETAPTQQRVVLRLGSLVAGDRALTEWAAALGVPADRVRHVRSGRVPAPDGIEVLVRVTGADVAAVVGAWLRRHQAVWRPTGRASTDDRAG